jgi:hypothetical protein
MNSILAGEWPDARRFLSIAPGESEPHNAHPTSGTAEAYAAQLRGLACPS